MLDNAKAFSGSSMSAHNVTGTPIYEVLSYETLILRIDLITGSYYFNERRYSNTTSHQQCILRAFLARVANTKTLTRRETFNLYA